MLLQCPNIPQTLEYDESFALSDLVVVLDFGLYKSKLISGIESPFSMLLLTVLLPPALLMLRSRAAAVAWGFHDVGPLSTTPPSPRYTGTTIEVPSPTTAPHGRFLKRQ